MTARKAISSRIQSLRQAKYEALRCLQCTTAPCNKACPAATNPSRFLRQLQLDNPEGAAETVLNNNAHGGTCGAVCPVSQLCEGACIRAKLDDSPVRIGAVQEFLHTWGVQQEKTAPGSIRLPPQLPRLGKTAAVVGSGPAGLSAARELQRLGLDVTVFEKRLFPGGSLRYFLSPVRLLDRGLVNEEIDRIRKMGVKIECEKHVTDLSTLRERFDHVVVSPGLQLGKSLAHIPGSLTALQFLESSNTDQALAREATQNKRVIVVGGGSVAMDVAITSQVLGASNVTVVFPESLDDMPADTEEVLLAQRYAITLLPERRLEHWEDKLAYVRHVHQEGEYDSLYADTIIAAIGQKHDHQTKDNLLNHDDVAYAGDAVNGGGTVVQAVAEGKRVAERISGRSLTDLDKLSHEGESEALAIDFCGIKFPNPFCLSSSPVTNTKEMCARAFDAGWGGVVYKTLNQETEQEILHPSPRLSAVHAGSSRIGIGLQNVEQISDRKLADNLEDIAWLKENYPSNVLGVSVMGFSDDSWSHLVRAAEDHGADWVELNFSCPQMRNEAGGHKVGQDLGLIERFTKVAKSACSIPVVAKMTPNLTDMVPAALAAQRGGADAVSAVNTFKSISHINVDYSAQDYYLPQPNIQGISSVSGFSGPACRPLALRFIADMAKDQRLAIPISGMGGIHTWKDALEFLSVGASNVQVTTAVMKHGLTIVEDLKDGILRHLRRLGHDNISEIVGAALPFVQSPEKLDLSTEAVSSIVAEKCIGCGICVTSCREGAVEAIALTSDGVALVDQQKCVGCQLCAAVCPVEGAVNITTRTRIER